MADEPDSVRRIPIVRLWAVAATWLLGLVAGVVALLAATARYGCTTGDGGPACTTTGSVVALVDLGTVVLTVGVVTAVAVSPRTRSARRLRRTALAGVVLLVALLVLAATLLGTS